MWKALGSIPTTKRKKERLGGGKRVKEKRGGKEGEKKEGRKEGRNKEGNY
jgi:hypothetical protein